jgi:hypothetical protein
LSPSKKHEIPGILLSKSLVDFQKKFKKWNNFLGKNERSKCNLIRRTTWT